MILEQSYSLTNFLALGFQKFVYEPLPTFKKVTTNLILMDLDMQNSK